MKKLQKIAQISMLINWILLIITFIPLSIFIIFDNKNGTNICSCIMCVQVAYFLLTISCAIANLIYYIGKEC